jgi:predicted small lipoprotein YifL
MLKKTLLLLAPVSVIALALSSCGQTGDLYLPKKEVVSSGSTIATSGSTIAKKDSGKVDNDPTPPVRSSDPQATELIASGDGSGFQQNIVDSAGAGGPPL